MTSKIAFLSMILILTGCSTASSTFSCNKTAGDSCLTIEDVDAMTRYADSPVVVQYARSKQEILIIKRNRHAYHIQ